MTTTHDAEHLAQQVADAVADRTVATAESCTAGALASALAAGGSASEWFRGGLVAYAEETKRHLLGVTAPSVVTPGAGAEMAAGAVRLLDAEIGVATTGVLGDEPVDGVDPGTVIVATLVDGEVRTCRLRVEADEADSAVTQAVQGALRLLLEHLATTAPRP